MRLHEVPEYTAYLDSLEGDYQLPRGLLSSVMRAESDGKIKAVSPVGAQGPFQFMPDTAKEYGIDPTDPIQAAEGAARYLRKSLTQFGTVEEAVASYNAGPGRIKRTGLAGAPRETRDYTTKVLNFLIPGAEAAEPPQDPYGFDQMSREEVMRIAKGGEDQGFDKMTRDEVIKIAGSDQPIPSMPFWKEEHRFKDEGIESVSPESWAIGGLGAGRLALGAGKMAHTGGKALVEGGKKFIRGASDEIKDMAKDLAVEEVVRYASGIPVVGGYVRPVYHLLRRGKDRPNQRSEGPPTPPAAPSKAEEIVSSVGKKWEKSSATVVDKGPASQEKIASILKTEKPRGAVEIEFVKKGTGERRTITGHLGIDKYAMSKGTPGPTDTLKVWEPARLTREALRATPPRPASAALTAHRKKLSPAKEFPGDEGYRSIPIKNILSIKPAGSKGKVEYRFNTADEVVAAVSKRKAKPPRVKFVKAPGAKNEVVPAVGDTAIGGSQRGAITFHGSPPAGSKAEEVIRALTVARGQPRKLGDTLKGKSQRGAVGGYERRASGPMRVYRGTRDTTYTGGAARPHFDATWYSTSKDYAAGYGTTSVHRIQPKNQFDFSKETDSGGITDNTRTAGEWVALLRDRGLDVRLLRPDWDDVDVKFWDFTHDADINATRVINLEEALRKGGYDALVTSEYGSTGKKSKAVAVLNPRAKTP